MPGAVAELIARVTADTSGFKTGLKGAESQARSFSAGVGKVGGTLTRTLTPAAAGIGIALKGAFQQADAGLDALRSGTNASGAALEELEASTKRVAGRVTADFSTVGQTMAELVQRTGATGKPLEELTTQILNLSEQTGTDASANVAALTRVFGDWGVATKDQASTLDLLFRASKATGQGVTELAAGVVQFGAPMRELKFSLAETTALLGSFERAGVNTELVMGGLKQGLGRLAKAGKDPRAELDKLSKAIDTAGLTAENRQSVFKIFGARAGIDMAKAIEEGRFKVSDLIKTISTGSDTINKTTADTRDLGDKIKMLGNRAVGAIGPFGEIGAVVAGGLASIGPALLGLSQVGPILGKIGKVGRPLGKVFQVVGSGFGTMASSIVSTGPAILGVFKSIGTGALALLSNPIVLAIAGIAIATVLIIKHWDKVKAGLSAVWNFLKAAASAVFGFLKTVFLNFTPHGQIIQNWNTIRAVLGAIWGAIKGAALAVFNFLKGFFVGVFNAYKAIITGAWNVIRNVTSAVWGAIRSIVSGATGAVRSVISAVSNFIRSAWSGAMSSLRSAASAAWAAVKSIFTGAWNFVKGIVSKITGAFSKLAFWRRSPSLLEVNATKTVAGVLDSFEKLSNTLPRTLSGGFDSAGKRGIAAFINALPDDLRFDVVPRILPALQRSLGKGFVVAEDFSVVNDSFYARAPRTPLPRSTQAAGVVNQTFTFNISGGDAASIAREVFRQFERIRLRGGVVAGR